MMEVFEPPENFAIVCPGWGADLRHVICGLCRICMVIPFVELMLIGNNMAGVYRSGFPGTRNAAFLKHIKLKFVWI